MNDSGIIQQPPQRIMPLTTAIVRILDYHGQTAGTGFLLTDDGLIATCAHVVRSAGAGPGEIVRLVFHAAGAEATATVEPDGWRALAVEDVAILRLTGPLPEGAEPLGTIKDLEETYMFVTEKALGGQVYGLPVTGNAQGVACNQKVLDAAGIGTD